jgi:hypothetical protein
MSILLLWRGSAKSSFYAEGPLIGKFSGPFAPSCDM